MNLQRIRLKTDCSSFTLIKLEPGSDEIENDQALSVEQLNRPLVIWACLFRNFLIFIIKLIFRHFKRSIKTLKHANKYF